MSATSDFYSIQQNDDGTVDVYLTPTVFPMMGPDGKKDFDIRVIVVRGVEPFDGLEDDIRARYSAWCASGEVVYL